MNFNFTWVLGLAFCLLFHGAHAQWRTLLADSFSGNRPIHFDLSTKLLWAGQSQPNTAFITDTVVTDRNGLSYPAIGLKPLAVAHAGYTRQDGLKTSIAIDYPFPIPIDRELDTIQVSFNLLWDTLMNSGESARVVSSLLHSYPEGGPDFGDIDSLNKEHPFARPAYNMRIMSKNQVSNNNLNAVMLYGGGHRRLGEIEKFRQGDNQWWLPGFSTEAGGFAPGSLSPYPSGGSAQLRNTPIASMSHWRRFTWTIYPNRLTSAVGNANAPRENDFQFFYMFIPNVDTLNQTPALLALNAFYGTNLTRLPNLYYWFPKIEAFRFFWNGGFNVWLSDLRIQYSGHSPLVTQTRNHRTEAVRLKVFPNPGNEKLTIEGAVPGAEVEIFDMKGRRTYSGFATELATTSWPKGLYVIRVGRIKALMWQKL
jgi:hypothetical protein